MDSKPNVQSTEYSREQNIEIQKGLEDGLDVSVYADPKYNDGQMRQLRLGLKNGVDVSVYANPDYNHYEMRILRQGLEDGLDVSVYANPKYDWTQMEEIREGLKNKNGIDVSVYADPRYDRNQMEELRLGLEKGLDVSVYANPEYDDRKMRQLRWGLEDGLDVSIYANPEYSWQQMEALRNLATIENALDSAGYNYETQIAGQTASMTIKPEHQYSDATFQINVKDIDLTGDDLHAKGQLIINNEIVTSETIDKIRKTHDKIITRTEQIMKMINSPEHDKEILQAQNIDKNR